MYASAKAGYLDGSMCWTQGVHRAQLWRNAAYAPLHTSVQNLIDAGGVLVASSQTLVTSVTASGAADAQDAYFDSVAKGPIISVLTIAQTSGPTGGSELPASEQRLVCFLNRGKVKGTPAAATSGGSLAFTPDGSPITVQWSDLITRIFQS